MLGRNYLLATALLILPMAANAAAVTSMQASFSGRPGPNNANCRTDCTKTFRENGWLKMVTLDGSGNVFAVSTMPLPDSAKLVPPGRTNILSVSDSKGNRVGVRVLKPKLHANSDSGPPEIVIGTTFVYRVEEQPGSYTTHYGIVLTDQKTYAHPTYLHIVTTYKTYRDTGPSYDYHNGRLTDTHKESHDVPIRNGNPPPQGYK